MRVHRIVASASGPPLGQLPTDGLPHSLVATNARETEGRGASETAVASSGLRATDAKVLALVGTPSAAVLGDGHALVAETAEHPIREHVAGAPHALGVGTVRRVPQIARDDGIVGAGVSLAVKEDLAEVDARVEHGLDRRVIEARLLRDGALGVALRAQLEALIDKAVASLGARNP